MFLQQTLGVIPHHRLPHAILVEFNSLLEAKTYVVICAKALLQDENLHVHPVFFTLDNERKSLKIKIEDFRSLIDLAQKKTANQRCSKVCVHY